MTEQYYSRLASAVTRGYFKRYRLIMDKELMEKSIDELTCEEMEKIISLGKQDGEIRLYNFKRPERMLPRVSRVLGFLKGVYLESLLDVGSGRGAFLIPFLDSFPQVSVTAVDLLDKRVDMLKDLQSGGISRLRVMKADICSMPLPPKSYDVVTMLEVLEHIPDYMSALSSAVKLARQYVVISVPSKPDDNPEHYHLFTKELLSERLYSLGAENVFTEQVHDHLIVIAKTGG